MTNQETIANLNMISVAFVEPVTKEQRKLIDDTFDNAIKALEQEPSGDLISKQSVLNACEQSINILEAVDRIMDLPSVEQEPKTGHWIFDEILDKHYYCSECKSMGVDYWDYCPYCGCRMVEPPERSDKE